MKFAYVARMSWLRSLHKPQKRFVHAQWSILLNHEWVYKAKRGDEKGNLTIQNADADGVITSDEPNQDINTKTVLLLHDYCGDLNMCMPLAHALTKRCSDVQCLVVDLRYVFRSQIIQ